MIAAVLFAVAYPATLAMAETRLFVPQFRFSDSEDTQFLIANQSDRDSSVDFWAFTSSGELLGQFHMPVRAHGTRALTLGEAFRLKDVDVSGWIGAVSSDDGIQLSYTRVGPNAESFEAQPWASREMLLSVADSEKDVVRFSNPNPFAASLTLRGTDPNGRFVGVEELSVAAFGQVEIPTANLLRGQAARLEVNSNADVLAELDRLANRRAGRTVRRLLEGEPDYLALVIDSADSIGAYQVTLRFDPRAVQFSTKDVEAGLSDGFDSKPLVVNIDNAAGEMTIGSFQVGAQPSGRIVVARLRTARNVRFGLKVEEITDTTGKSLSDVPVGIVRMQ